MNLGERKFIKIVPDESIVYSNDAVRIIWDENGHRELRPKSTGRALHVSGFCCCCHGFISSNGKDTFDIMKPGKVLVFACSITHH